MEILEGGGGTRQGAEENQRKERDGNQETEAEDRVSNAC